jgi:phosphopantothenoylcysteine decarboxylase/phosphopantothenate--cysteine ligase
VKSRSPLKNSSILLGITGSVAAYKALELSRRLREEGAQVRAVLSSTAHKFITPLSIQLATGQKPLVELFQEPLAHVSLPEQAQLFIIAPATANTIAKLALGLAEDALSTTFLAFRGPAIIAPAMNYRMYENPLFRENLRRLQEAGVQEVPPEKGPLACGAEAIGRMASLERILEAARAALSPQDLKGHHLVITAGPTREPLDAVRFISNRSSGKMGYALATVALRRGAQVSLITGPTSLPPPPGAHTVSVETTTQMHQAVLQHTRQASALLMAAAVADFSPYPEEKKIEKTGKLALKLKPTVDILADISKKRKGIFLVGFAAEAGPMVGRAEEKLRAKGLHMVVFNDVLEPGAGFDSETNKVVILDRWGGKVELPLLSKEEVAYEVLDRYKALKT